MIKAFTEQVNNTDLNAPTKDPRAVFLLGNEAVINSMLLNNDFSNEHPKEELFEYPDLGAHPYFGHISLEKWRLKQCLELANESFHSSGRVMLVIGVIGSRMNNTIRWLGHSVSFNDQELFNISQLEKTWNSLGWTLTEESKEKGWTLRRDCESMKLIHFGRDEEILNPSLEYKYSENYETIVDEFINSSVEIISKLGAYNISKILSFLDIDTINVCYNSCRLLRRLLDSRDFIMSHIQEKCVTLPKRFTEYNFELIREKTIPEMKDIIFNYSRKLSIINNFSITWLNGAYWKRENRSDSPFKTVAHLAHVWWFDITGKITLLKGHYEVFIMYKNTSSYGRYHRSRFNIRCLLIEDEQEERKADFSNLCSSFVMDAAPLSSKLHKLGEIKTETAREDFRFTIYDHDCSTIKQDMDFDYLEFVRK
nr:unnamed protein product [Naegleria fowleri]